MRGKWNTGTFQNLHFTEHDSCGIVAIINKNGQPSAKNISQTLDALKKMEHRSGFVNGEGDGCGILTDIPRDLWRERFKQLDLPANLVFSPQFFVAHLFIPAQEDLTTIQTHIRSIFQEHRSSILHEQEGAVRSHVLGAYAKKEEPFFWQVAGWIDTEDEDRDYGCTLFNLAVDIEKQTPVHVASLSNQTCVYKVMGSASVLPEYFEDIAHPLFSSSVTIGHNRYSTNTLSNFFRVQPFSLLGHNGEINTIHQLRQEALMIGTPLVEGGSDSQDLNRTLETLIHRHNLSLFEAMEMVFPPILHEIKQFEPKLQDLYVQFRQSWGHFAQGPAGIVSRYGDECVFSVDALGLRPLWMVETEEVLYFSSEQGLVPADEMIHEPKPLAPGEKVGVQITPEGAAYFPYHDFQTLVYERYSRKNKVEGKRQMLSLPLAPQTEKVQPRVACHLSTYAAFGWNRDDIQLAEQMAQNGAEPIRSLGHDGPLAALSKERQNVADYLKESVAVVTNPAIDREREMEHFSTRIVLGERRALTQPSNTDSDADGDRVAHNLELPSPVLLEGEVGKRSSANLGTFSYEQVLAFYQTTSVTLQMVFHVNESISAALERIKHHAVEAVKQGAQLIVLDDGDAHQDGMYWLDPHVVVSAVDQHLAQTFDQNGISLRRKTSIVLRSAAIRSLHDLVLACGLGANAVNPYLLFATVTKEDKEDHVQSAEHLYAALNKGLEKVISTIGIHELRGYNRIFSSIGLKQEVADVLNIVNFCGSDQVGYGFQEMEEDSKQRWQDYRNESAKPSKTFRFFPRVWKALGQLSTGDISYEQYGQKVAQLEKENPVSIRHVLELNTKQKKNAELAPDDVHIGVGEHDLPFVISSMSFGSQNEVAYRAYAEAAEQLNMISLNGEGGEIKELIGKYPRTRGLQVASGRFGVNVELANSANLLEIKIGQGAKPGEGGHLPGTKVTEKIAAARNATPGSDLISPSNNHDIYSIEDLAQIITELKTANPEAKVIVKVPVVPNIGTISVGIAKAGADVVNLSGFDGGTGAARVHAIQHVGLPAEIGVKLAHNALLEAGLRNQVELWCDGGVRSATDAIKLMILGANRIGFGTLAMIAVGCTTCRGCHLDTCHVGIATQIDSEEEAKEKGLKRFVPRQFDLAVSGLKNLFTAFGAELKRLCAALGYERLQDLVGQSHLLVQALAHDSLDLQAMLEPLNIDQLPHTAVAQLNVPQQLAVAAGAEAQVHALETSHDHQQSHTFAQTLADQRVLGSLYASKRVKSGLDGSYKSLPDIQLSFAAGSIPGNGLAAFNAEGIHIRLSGGAQDGVGKCSYGGSTTILKSKNKVNEYVNGSVGKGFCYGAQKGLFIVQGNADSRAGIRLSGADVVIGGEVTQPLQDHLGLIGARANIKGFAFEYMTNGRALILGDPGPWMCSGMTGGVVYQRLVPHLGLDQAAIERRIAKAAKVSLEPLSEQGVADVKELLTAYIEQLRAANQKEKAEEIAELRDNCAEHFIQIVPQQQQADPSVSTE